jgi:hypothetical protein
VSPVTIGSRSSPKRRPRCPGAGTASCSRTGPHIWTSSPTHCERWATMWSPCAVAWALKRRLRHLPGSSRSLAGRPCPRPDRPARRGGIRLPRAGQSLPRRAHRPEGATRPVCRPYSAPMPRQGSATTTTSSPAASWPHPWPSVHPATPVSASRPPGNSPTHPVPTRRPRPDRSPR